MKQYSFIITDINHKVCYASERASAIFGRPVNELTNQNLLKFTTPPCPTFIGAIIESELNKYGFYNGVLKFQSAEFWFCDYGKRFDTQGKHIGYELVLTPATQATSDYMGSFYLSLTEKAQINNAIPGEVLYRNELNDLSESLGTDFVEFLSALQNEN